MSKVLYSGVVVALVGCLLVGSSLAQDPVALAQCRAIHHMEAELIGSAFYEHNCLLLCNLHGHIHSHAINEGRNCSVNNSSHACQNGQCVLNEHVGFVDVELTSGSFSKVASLYATICVQNSSTPVTLPMNNRFNCFTCSSGISGTTATPVWKTICANLKGALFSDQSRVTFELWDYLNPGALSFAGGATITIPEVMQLNSNNQPRQLTLTGGQMKGYINAVITYTTNN